MTAQQESTIKDHIERYAMQAVTLLKDLDSLALFVTDNGGFAVDTTIAADQQTAYNALLQIRAVLNGWDVTTGVYRQPLNQILPSAR
jgi:hypothetical protein